jgi:hypothetical protein
MRIVFVLLLFHVDRFCFVFISKKTKKNDPKEIKTKQKQSTKKKTKTKTIHMKKKTKQKRFTSNEQSRRTKLID